jgi:hypothetical protein
MISVVWKLDPKKKMDVSINGEKCEEGEGEKGGKNMIKVHCVHVLKGHNGIHFFKKIARMI